MRLRQIWKIVSIPSWRRPELQLPLVLVLLAPLELTICDGLTTHNGLESGMLVCGACHALQFSLGDRGIAAKATCCGEQRQQEQGKNSKGAHVYDKKATDRSVEGRL